jgi:hypothetical protein
MRTRFSAMHCIRLAALCLVLTAPAEVTAADSVSFSGKRIEVVVPFAPGGGSDVYIRAIAPFLEKHLPGQPSIVIRNIPGAGGIPGANQFAARARPDGTEAIVVSSSTVSNFVFQKGKVEYDLNKWEPVLLSPQGSVVYAAPSLGVQGPKDLPKLRGKEVVFGGHNASSAELRTIVTFELLGPQAPLRVGVESRSGAPCVRTRRAEHQLRHGARILQERFSARQGRQSGAALYTGRPSRRG